MIRPEVYELMRETWRDSIPYEFRFKGWDRLDAAGERQTFFEASNAARQERTKARQAADNAKRQRRKTKGELKRAIIAHA